MHTSPYRVALTFVFAASSAYAQLTLEQAVQQAMTRYPAVRASLQQVSAAAAGINLARTNYLPRADFMGHLNRATHNNVFGMMPVDHFADLRAGAAYELARQRVGQRRGCTGAMGAVRFRTAPRERRGSAIRARRC